MHIALISDSHLSVRAPECVDNWHSAARVVAAARPDLTIHLGDITLDGERDPGELAFAAQLIRAWPTPMHCVLGNHDMGTGSGEEPLSHRALSRGVSAIGPDRWKLRAREWTLIGINAQLLGTGTTEESIQRDWLERQAQKLGRADRVALFLHRPVRRPLLDSGMEAGRYVAEESSRWLLSGPLQSHLRLVVSGHTHQALNFVAKGVRHIWVPSSSFVISDALQQRVGEKVVGLGWLNLLGTERLEYMQVSPAVLVQHELTQLSFYQDLVKAE